MFHKKADFFWLVKDSVIGDGKMTIPTNTSIAGLLKMDIECAGKVIVAATGEVRGTIKASEVQIYGQVAGDIIVSEGLTIYKSGVVRGSIFSKKLFIEEGAKCDFQMTVGEHNKPVLLKEDSSNVSDAAEMGMANLMNNSG